jgi:hypothetical protein
VFLFFACLHIVLKLSVLGFFKFPLFISLWPKYLASKWEFLCFLAVTSEAHCVRGNGLPDVTGLHFVKTHFTDQHVISFWTCPHGLTKIYFYFFCIFNKFVFLLNLWLIKESVFKYLTMMQCLSSSPCAFIHLGFFLFFFLTYFWDYAMRYTRVKNCWVFLWTEIQHHVGSHSMLSNAFCLKD